MNSYYTFKSKDGFERRVASHVVHRHMDETHIDILTTGCEGNVFVKDVHSDILDLVVDWMICNEDFPPRNEEDICPQSYLLLAMPLDLEILIADLVKFKRLLTAAVSLRVKELVIILKGYLAICAGEPIETIDLTGNSP